MKMRKVVVVVLAVVLALGLATPVGVFGAAEYGRVVPVIERELPDSLPMPMELTANEPGMIHVVSQVPYFLRIFPGIRTGAEFVPWFGRSTREWRMDLVVTQDVEGVMMAMVFEDGTAIEAVRRVFGDGEIWTLIVDMSVDRGLAELYVVVAVVRGDVGGIYRLVGSGGSELWGQPNSPYMSNRPEGPGSVFDVIVGPRDRPSQWVLSESFLAATGGGLAAPVVVPVTPVTPVSPVAPVAVNLASASAWAHEGISGMAGLGLIPAGLTSDFGRAITRAEFAALAVALYESRRGEIAGRVTFVDTNDVNVQKAAAVGIVTGVGDGRFAPNSNLTREQAAVMLVRLADLLAAPVPHSSPTFADNAAISGWAFGAVGRVAAAGIMGGTGGNRFSPNGTYTREQAVVTVWRLHEMLR